MRENLDEREAREARSAACLRSVILEGRNGGTSSANDSNRYSINSAVQGTFYTPYCSTMKLQYLQHRTCRASGKQNFEVKTSALVMEDSRHIEIVADSRHVRTWATTPRPREDDVQLRLLRLHKKGSSATTRAERSVQVDTCLFRFVV